MAGRGPRTGDARRPPTDGFRGPGRDRTADRDPAGPRTYPAAGAVGYTTGAACFEHTTGTEGPDTAGPWASGALATADPSVPGAISDQPHPPLVQIRDLAGRPRGVGFLADHQGTLLTSHEAVDGLPRLVLQTAGGDRTCVVAADAVTPLPALDLALVRTDGLGLDPLPLTVRERIDAGTYVRLPAGCWREARILAATEVTYTATDRFHLLPDALELAIGTAGQDALRLGGGAAGGPVLDARTGAVLGVLGTALHSAQRDTGFAVPLRPADGPLAELLARNAATVPAYGADLNLAGMLQLTETSVGQDGPQRPLAGAVEPVERPALVRELAAFTDGGRAVLGLVGAPGSGRTTVLADLAARRARGERPAPTLWLRGADLEDTDASVADAARRALERAARIVATARRAHPESLGDLTSDDLARLAARAGRPLLLVLDGPEEMPPVLAHRLPDWTRGTADWLRRTGARLVVACGEEYWEHAGAELPTDLLHTPTAPAAPSGPETAGVFVAPAVTETAAATPAVTETAAATSAATASGAEPSGVLVAPAVAATAPVTGTTSAATSAVTSGTTAVGVFVAPAVTVTAATPPGADTARATSVATAPGTKTATTPFAATPPAGIATPAADTTPFVPLPPCLCLSDLTEDEARQARARYGLPDGLLAERDARHPLTLRLLAEVWAAAPDVQAGAVPLDRHDVFAAHLDLMCLRIAVRLAVEGGLRGTAVRRLAARVAGQVHDAARRSLGPGQGELDRASFEAVFPWGPAPARLGGGTGWASAVLAEGLLVPAGRGYRFAHEELADWIQGMHLDLDEALHALVHRAGTPHPVPVPHHRAGPVVQALLLLARQHGHRQLTAKLWDLTDALDRDPGSWWAARLLARTLLQVPDATPYTGVLRRLADRIVAWRSTARPVPAEFGPGFWTELPITDTERLDLLRRLVPADQAPSEPGERYLDAVARLLAAAPAVVQPALTRWFDDERPLPATPHATVATAAQALLHTHRHGALDDLTEVLAASGHRRADELLTTLAEDEPAAVCRAVDRWAHDERPARRLAAVTHGLRAAPHVRSEADRRLLRYAALTLLARPADRALHGGALALLVRDPHSRDRHLASALRHFADGDPHLPPSALAPTLTTHPEPVLEAFRARLCHLDATDTRQETAHPDPAETRPDETLHTLTDVTTPALARSVAALLQESARLRPPIAGPIAAHVDRRLAEGPTVRPVLLPLVTGLLDDGPDHLRAALAGVLAAAGTPACRPLRRELLELLLAREEDPSVLDAVLQAAATEHGDDREEEVRGLVHRTGLLLVRTPEGAARFDRGLVDLGRHVPGFAARMTGWLAAAPDDWAAVVGPSTRRMLENLAGVRVPA
ncbi:trypsin-like peptidase domain-containing protein [Streptomyces sp. NPDC048304]|uniref:trypsin-like peptidase domain-containing protein n=1 Tax=Streptomyces sp. NPDC048304 TaxID=3154820 RepID=UPI0033F41770